MADSSDGLAGLIVGLIGGAAVVTLGAAAVATHGGGQRRPALPALPPPKLPQSFLPIRTSRRVVERKGRVEEDGHTYPAKLYEPPMIPAPWTVRAWYEPHREAHVIDVEAHPTLSEGLSAKVYVGDAHQADREKFKRGKSPLWPDDKFTNRVVHRAPGAPRDLCFLIDITCCDLALDFFHEPFASDALMLADQRPEYAKDFALMQELQAIEERYQRDLERVTEDSNLAPAVKRSMQWHLEQVREQAVERLLAKRGVE